MLDTIETNEEEVNTHSPFGSSNNIVKDKMTLNKIRIMSVISIKHDKVTTLFQATFLGTI